MKHSLLAGALCLALTSACGGSDANEQAAITAELAAAEAQAAAAQQANAPAPGAAAARPSAQIKGTDLFRRNVHGIESIFQMEGFFLSGQPDPAGLREAKANGIRTIVSLRMPAELGEQDEGATVEALGMAWENPGFGSAEALTDELFAEIRATLNDESKQPLLLHCASANRVGAVWLAHRILDHGITWEQASVEARTVGLRSPELYERACAYLTSQGYTLPDGASTDG